MSDSLSDLFSEDVEPAEAPPRHVMKFDYAGDDSALDNAEYFGDGVDLTKPWMKFHRFELVTTADQVRELVDRALRVGRVALDLETQGLDSRIEYRADGSCYTRHQIVGYCLGLEGEGYYIPVRHIQDRGPNPNVDSVEKVEAEIKRLCEAAQPVLKNGSIDVLGAKEKDFEVPPRVVIEFWHAKFDQEFLYPVTGIDVWNPASFDDGMLMVYTLCTEDDQGLKDNAYARIPAKVDPKSGEECRYEMIKFEDLFAKNMKSSDRKFQTLEPRHVGAGPGRNVVLYGCSDGICTNLLCGLLLPQVQQDKQQASFYALEKQVVQVVRVIERTRVLINKGEISSLLAEAEKELEECEALIRARAIGLGFPSDFNPSSSAQLADFLFGPQGIWKGRKPEKTAEGQYKTDEKTIEQLAKETGAPDVFGLIIKHRQINKVRGTYLVNLANNTDELNQLRLNFKQTGAATGRFTAPKGDPDHGYAGVPIQGIPAKNDAKKPKVAHSLRRLFIARPGYILIKADYASQELRIAASTSGEQKWIAEYEKEATTGEAADLHYLTALAFYPGLTKDAPDFKLKRNSGKTANFALIYGGGVGAVQRATGCDKIEGARLKKAFDDSVPGFSRWVKGQHKRVKEDRGVYTAFRRFISIPDANLDRTEVIRRWKEKGKKFSESEVAQEVKKVRAACERKATNYPIQGAGADILKISLVLLLREFHLRGWLKNGGDDSVRMVMTVHDEIVFEVREDRVAEAVPVLVRIMESPSRLLKSWKVPLVAEAELGSSWAGETSWGKVLNGKEPPPPYLVGKALVRDPEVLVLAKKSPSGASTPPPAPVILPPPAAVAAVSATTVPAAPPSAMVAPPPVETLAPPPAPKLPAPAVAMNGNGHSTKVASVQLKSTFVDKDTVLMIAQACIMARLACAKLERRDEEIPVEFLSMLDDRWILLYSAAEDYRVYVPELVRNLENMNLLHQCVIRDAHA